MPVSEAQKRASAKWDKKHMTTISIKVTREMAEEFTGACDILGITRSRVLRDAVKTTICLAKHADK